MMASQGIIASCVFLALLIQAVSTGYQNNPECHCDANQNQPRQVSPRSSGYTSNNLECQCRDDSKFQQQHQQPQQQPRSTGYGSNNFECVCNDDSHQQFQQVYQQPQQQQPQQQQPQQQQPQQQQYQQQQHQPHNQQYGNIIPVPVPVPVPIPQRQPSKKLDYEKGKNKNSEKEKKDKDDCDYCNRLSCKPAGCLEAPNFDPARDAKALHTAVKGVGTDEDTLINILTKRSDKQVEAIRQEYVRSGESLLSDIQGDTSFKTKELLIALVTPRPLFYAEQIHKALEHGDADALIEIFTSLSDCAIREIASTYETRFHVALSKDIKSDTWQDFKNFLVALAQGNRQANTQNVDKELAKRDADALVNAGVKKTFGTDEQKIIDIFAHRSLAHLKEVVKQYNLKRPSGIEADLKSETSGKLRAGLLAMVRNVNDQPAFLAEELEKSLKTRLLPGPKNNEKLVRIMRGRCGVDLGDIRDAYRKNHDGKTLESRIQGKTYMDYENALLSMLKE